MDVSRSAVFYRDPHICVRCRYRSNELLWQCPHCHEWNTFVEERMAAAQDGERAGGLAQPTARSSRDTGSLAEPRARSSDSGRAIGAFMLKVALTGGIATGKSYVREKFESLGVPTIDADVLARDAVRPSSPYARRPWSSASAAGDPRARRDARSAGARRTRLRRRTGAHGPRGDHPSGGLHGDCRLVRAPRRPRARRRSPSPTSRCSTRPTRRRASTASSSSTCREASRLRG